jgi:hypothetical protein
MTQVYPDISAILQAKRERRFALAALSWEEKVAIIEQMQRLLPPGQWKGGVIREQAPPMSMGIRKPRQQKINRSPFLSPER